MVADVIPSMPQLEPASCRYPAPYRTQIARGKPLVPHDREALGESLAGSLETMVLINDLDATWRARFSGFRRRAGHGACEASPSPGNRQETHLMITPKQRRQKELAVVEAIGREHFQTGVRMMYACRYGDALV